MPLHVTDIATLFRRWWLAKVYSVSMQTEVVNTSAASLQYWWPFIVWLTSMKDLIFYDEQQYRQMYMQFTDRAHLHIMTQTDVNPDTSMSATALVDRLAETRLFPSLHQVRALQHCLLAEVRWREIMMQASELVPDLSMLKFVVAELNVLAATCNMFRDICREIVARITDLLHAERPWAFFVDSLPSIPKLNVQSLEVLWPP
jgi:hypothetical protein